MAILLVTTLPGAASAATGEWNVVPTPNPPDTQFCFSDGLAGVTALSATDVWAVGGGCGANGPGPLIEHWDGSSWSIVVSATPPQPGSLLGVSAVAVDDVWAVGGDSGNTLVEHWDGSAWSIVASPNAGGSSFLTAVSALSGNDVWAVGASFVSGSEQSLIEHWDGTGWSVIPGPSPGSSTVLSGVSGISASDVWAVGQYFNGISVQPLAEHWDGTNWSVATTPSIAFPGGPLAAVSASSANDVWAVGGNTQSLIEHWNGASWSIVASPNVANTNNTLSGVAAISPNNAWAVGSYFDRFVTGSLQTLIEHWDGTAWNIVTSPNGGTGSSVLAAVATDSLGDAWAVGTTAGPPLWRTLVLSSMAVHDTTPPVITVSGPITVNATSPAGAVVNYSVTATDPDDTVASLACVPASGSTFPTGTTTVTCTASDTHGNTSTASFTVHVKGASEQLADLQAAVTGVGPGTSLADKVSQTQAYLAVNDVVDACSTLGAFVNQVKAQSGKTIASGQAATLIATAQRIEAVLGC